MTTYIIRRLLLTIPTFFGTTFLVFWILNITPGGPFDQAVEQIERAKTQSMDGGSGGGGGAEGEKGSMKIDSETKRILMRDFGVDKPIWHRYFIWLGLAEKEIAYVEKHQPNTPYEHTIITVGNDKQDQPVALQKYIYPIIGENGNLTVFESQEGTNRDFSGYKNIDEVNFDVSGLIEDQVISGETPYLYTIKKLKENVLLQKYLYPFCITYNDLNNNGKFDESETATIMMSEEGDFICDEVKYPDRTYLTVFESQEGTSTPFKGYDILPKGENLFDEISWEISKDWKMEKAENDCIIEFEWDAEYFIDVNGNGKWDDAEKFVDAPNGVWDVGEELTDVNRNGKWDDAEYYNDANGNGKWDEISEQEIKKINYYNNNDWAITSKDFDEKTIAYLESLQNVLITTDCGIIQRDLSLKFEILDDANGNGKWDDAEKFVDAPNGVWDVGEELTDVNGNGKWDGAEYYNDANGNGKWDDVTTEQSCNADLFSNEKDSLINTAAFKDHWKETDWLAKKTKNNTIELSYKAHKGIFQGYLGETKEGKSVAQEIYNRLHISAFFGITGFLLSYLICIPLGIMKALRHGSKFDITSSGLVFIGYSIPNYAFGVLMIWLFASTSSPLIGWGFFEKPVLPSGGWQPPNWDEIPSLSGKIIAQLEHAFLPTMCYMLGSFATLTVLMKNSLMENMSQDYVRTAFAKGLKEKTVIFKHAVRNSLIPLATGIGGLIGIFLAGSYLIEKVFAIDGIGKLGFESIQGRDYGIFLGFLVIGTIIRLLGNLISDICYAIIDPRIRFQ